MIAKAEDLDIVMPIYNLLEYSGNISMTLGNLWNYYGEEVKVVRMKTMVLVITRQITARQKQVNLLNIRQK